MRFIISSLISNLQTPISKLQLCLLLALLVACAPATPAPTSTSTPISTPTLIPSPTPTPAPTPTATPVPPLVLTIRWPERVSALRPVPIEVELVPPPGVSVTATVRVAVVDPQGLSRWLFDLTPYEGNLYTAEEWLQLPLEPPEGDWRLLVYVWSDLKVEGDRELVFRPVPVHFRDLADVLPAGADIHVPLDFVEVASQGDQWAGGRVWRYGDDEVALWWAPGPIEPLLLSNAVVMLEATRNSDGQPRVLDVEETEWQGQTAFLFYEDTPGSEGGLAEALVVQGPDYWLYVLQVRALGGETIPPLLRQVWETFTLCPPEG